MQQSKGSVGELIILPEENRILSVVFVNHRGAGDEIQIAIIVEICDSEVVAVVIALRNHSSAISRSGRVTLEQHDPRRLAFGIMREDVPISVVVKVAAVHAHWDSWWIEENLFACKSCGTRTLVVQNDDPTLVLQWRILRDEHIKISIAVHICEIDVIDIVPMSIDCGR